MVVNRAMWTILGERTTVGTTDGPSLIAVPEVRGGVAMVPQAHGGALKAGGTPGNAGGGRAAHFGRA